MRRPPILVPLLAGALLLGLAAPAAAATTQRLSVRSNGAQGTGGYADQPATAGRARWIAFASGFPNLVPGDTNGVGDIFVRDTVTGKTTRVSVSSAEAQANDESSAPAISADGRFVAFSSIATNLVPGDTNGTADVFLRDRKKGTTRRVSVGTGGTEGSGTSISPAISADGGLIAFASWASDLVPNDTNGFADIFVHARVAKTMVRVSVRTGGPFLVQGNGDAREPAIDAEGVAVAFASDASNLVTGDTNGATDIFAVTLRGGTVRRVSITANGSQASGPSAAPSLASGGRLVAFASDATNMVPNDTNGVTDVFWHERLSEETVYVSRADGMAGPPLGGDAPRISGNGRFVAFVSTSAQLVPNDTNGAADVFVRSLFAETTRRVSLRANGGQSNAASDQVAIGIGPRRIVFRSYATNLVAGDTNTDGDVFLRVR